MSDDLIVTVKAALVEYDATAMSESYCVGCHNDVDVAVWLRALVDRCEQAEAQNARNVGRREVCEDLSVQLEAEKQRHQRTRRELDRCIDARRANVDAVADALGVPKDVTRIDEAHRIALDNLAALRERTCVSCEMAKETEAQLKAEVKALRQRHAEAVERAFRRGFFAGADDKGMAVSWHWANAKARLA